MTDLSKAIEDIDAGNYNIESLRTILTAARRWNALERGLQKIGFESWAKQAIHDLRTGGHPAKADALDAILNAMEIE